MKKIVALLAVLAWTLSLTAQTSSAESSAKESGQAKKTAPSPATAPAAPAEPFPLMTQLPTGATMLDPGLGSTSFTFVVAGDNRPAHSSDPLTKPMLDMVQRLAANPPDFVVWNGDTVYGKQ
ncbi:MAG TPA: hypothetical protein VHX14_09915, partial [Thermoanaerobaculia bacterium]|nr:hypothetical protein [Thermoanaerobaculia bacterium]